MVGRDGDHRNLGVRKLANTAADHRLELNHAKYERAPTPQSWNDPWMIRGPRGHPAVTAVLDGLLHHTHVLKCGPWSCQTEVQTDLRTDE